MLSIRFNHLNHRISRPSLRSHFKCGPVHNSRVDRSLHVAIVGSGPAGFYTADELNRANIPDLKVDMYEKLPTPYGLVRSGVAPDHPEVKSVQSVFHSLAKQKHFRFIGNVQVGKDLSIHELKNRYQVVVLAYGAEDDRKLNIPGENLVGVHSARTFVEWYNSLAGSPSLDETFDLSGKSAVVIGNGNVAVDVARILLSPLNRLSSTDISSEALKKLSQTSIKQVHVVGRRGPVQASFTTKELRELIQLEGVTTCLGDRMLAISEADEKELQNRPKKRLFELLQKLITVHIPTEDQKQLQLHFLKNPVEFVEDKNRPGHVGSVKFEHTFLKGEPNKQVAVGLSYFSEIPANIVFTSIGYRSKPIDGLPFDEKMGIIPNKAGKVERGVFVCGWLKRGPSGIIGTNKFDAEEVVGNILNDYNKPEDALESIPKSTTIDGSNITEDPFSTIEQLLGKRGVRYTTFEEWEALDNEEQNRGTTLNKIREKIRTVDEMLQVCKK